MKSRLSAIQVEYVLVHLGHHAELSDQLRQLIRYGDKPAPGTPAVYFPASEKALDLEAVITIDEVPVLYPLANETTPFYTIKEGSLDFHHDLLKSIFHLLSGYEELKNEIRDEYGRFPYSESLAYKLGIIHKPVVNYYMEIILKALQEFCKKSGIPFKRRVIFEHPVLMLSHDVDLIDAYDFKETAYKFKQLLGLAESPYNFRGKAADAFTALYHFLNPFSRTNPFWSFNRLMEWEAERNIRSTYFFLEKDGKYDNSRYSFQEPRIRKLMAELAAQGHEIGIHGTMQSWDDPGALNSTLERLRAVSPDTVSGIRQHYLRFKPGLTASLQAKAGLLYDASLGFSEHDGFRFAYCWPHKFFDFKKQQILDLWEIPLTLMDVSHFYKRGLDMEQSREAVKVLSDEVVRFKGIFSLLWHNSFFNEREFPGITEHYTWILDHCRSQGMEGITGKEIVSRIRSAGA